MNRRSINKPILSSTNTSAAASIKMTQEDLEVYAKHLEDRAKEAEVFFKSESEDEGDTGMSKESKNDQDTIAPMTELFLPVKEILTTELVDKTQETFLNKADNLIQDVNMLNKDTEHNKKDEATNCVMEIPIGLENSTNVNDYTLDELNVEVVSILKNGDAVKIKDNITKSINEDAFRPLSDSEDEIEQSVPKTKAVVLSQLSGVLPQLSGGPDMIIHLDEDLVMPKGVSQLMERFVKHSIIKNKPQDKIKMSVISTETGILEKDVIFVNVEDDNKAHNIKPGAALIRLKQELEAKIALKRSEHLTRRLKESQDIEDMINAEEMDEELEMTDSESSSDDDDETVESEQVQNNNLLEIEADEADDEDDGNDSAEDDEELELKDNNLKTITKRKSRITVLSDSDDSDIENLDKHKENELNLSGCRPARSSTDLFTSQDFDDDRDDIPVRQVMGTQFNKSANLSTSDVGLLSPVLRLTALQGMPSPSKISFEESPISPVTFTQVTPTQDQISHLQKKLFADPEATQSNMDELLDLCSGTFSTIKPTQATTQDELLDLCSGEFVSQLPQPGVSDTGKDSVAKVQQGALSTDEEDEVNSRPKPKKKSTKQKQLMFSDDESEHENSEESEIEEANAERIIVYDSEENEIDIQTEKQLKDHVAKTFFDNEAELSESDWGSADEDEKDMDTLEAEMGDAEQFDSKKIRRELEQIHMRHVMDEDNREVQLLQELLLENSDGHPDATRDRKFRWKNIDGNFLDDKPNDTDNSADGSGTDEEGEQEWRKLRHEKELLLRENALKENRPEPGSSSLADMLVVNKTSFDTKKNFVLVKNKTPKLIDTNLPKSHFLIASNQSKVKPSRGSFLGRDKATLDRLVALTRVGGEEGQGTGTLSLTNKGNFVFSTLSPADDKKADKTRKRKSVEADILNIAKRPKVNQRPQASKRLLLDHLQ